jgi:flagellar basal-body rod protein FlgC
MIQGIYSALSALRAFGQRLGVTANNIANMDTEGFKKSKAVFEEASPYGVNVTIRRIETQGFPLPSEEGINKVCESSNVDIKEEMINLITVPHAYAANLKSVKAEDEILGTLLDIVDR